jgi:hypothetical protein
MFNIKSSITNWNIFFTINYVIVFIDIVSSAGDICMDYSPICYRNYYLVLSHFCQIIDFESEKTTPISSAIWLLRFYTVNVIIFIYSMYY